MCVSSSLTSSSRGTQPGMWKELTDWWLTYVQDNMDDATRAILNTVKVEPKHLINKWLATEKDAKAFIWNSGAQKSSTRGPDEPKFSLPYLSRNSRGKGKKNISRGGAREVTVGEEILRAGKLSKDNQEDHENQTPMGDDEGGNKDGVFDEEMENNKDDDALLHRITPGPSKPSPNLLQPISDAMDITIGEDRYSSKNTQAEAADKCYPRSKQFKTGKYEHLVVGARISKVQTGSKRAHWADIAATAASANSPVKIMELKLQHMLQVEKMRMERNRQMAKAKLRAEVQAAWDCLNLMIPPGSQIRNAINILLSLESGLESGTCCSAPRKGLELLKQRKLRQFLINNDHASEREYLWRASDRESSVKCWKWPSGSTTGSFIRNYHKKHLHFFAKVKMDSPEPLNSNGSPPN
ncbi:hypothetical protein BDK51DRAFT_30751 [Blyttiomyces helicus]|uniref:Uncharacterized protein n=1 Tax=Blyttiomyces helicus TaxID=388810 RepID=A0A4P9WEE6_9FUNG|nr:hypothetical protein BDK51DRAFT_30751 [Blyttiomyces helicus]|eukprot:RKO90964.1 hypothetical protein BDK51DRAFT_30751 [Blyttiomyces helicus]